MKTNSVELREVRNLHLRYASVRCKTLLATDVSQFRPREQKCAHTVDIT
jgi:hypothetical protein